MHVNKIVIYYYIIRLIKLIDTIAYIFHFSEEIVLNIIHSESQIFQVSCLIKLKNYNQPKVK